jgi:uncharacterized SAM-binding protein YcdF (DUF218 family)
MFFILSKLLLFLISPFFWIITLLVWSFLTKKERRKRVLRVIVLGLFITFSSPLLLNVLVRAWQPKPVDLPAGKQYSAAIHLGGVSMTDIDKRMYFGEVADRFIQATKLYHTSVVKNVVVTGGSPVVFGKRRIPEANQLRQQLLMQGIPDSSIIVENRSWNTFENAVNTKRILDSLRLPPPYVLVTSAVHVPRATAVFKKAGLDVIAYPSAYSQIEQKFSFNALIPSLDVLTDWDFFLKEVVGFAVYRITGKA